MEKGKDVLQEIVFCFMPTALKVIVCNGKKKQQCCFGALYNCLLELQEKALLSVSSLTHAIEYFHHKQLRYMGFLRFSNLAT